MNEKTPSNIENDPRVKITTQTFFPMGPAQTREVYFFQGHSFYSIEELYEKIKEVEAIDKVIGQMKNEFRYTHQEEAGETYAFCKTLEEFKAVSQKHCVHKTAWGMQFSELGDNYFINKFCRITPCYDGDGSEIDLEDRSSIQKSIDISFNRVNDLTAFLHHAHE